MTAHHSYTRRHDHVVALARAGLKRGEIAAELGLPTEAVGRSLATARRKNLLPPVSRAAPVAPRARESKSRKDDVVRLAREGMAPREIAVELGCAPATVHHYLWVARREDGFTAWFKTGAPREVGSSSTVLPRQLADALRPIAAGRGLTVPELARAILSRVADDNLVDAVLDDGDEEAPHVRNA